MKYDNQYLTKAQIVKQIGYFPAFLLPIIDSSLICHSLVQRTLYAYINNPLPTLLKEKLFIYLSYHCGVDYFTICHSCSLYSLGVSAKDILALVKIQSPQIEEDLSSDLHLLEYDNQYFENWHQNVQVETSLLRCSSLIFLHPSESTQCSVILKRFLEKVSYNYLLVFLGYIKLCHQWIAFYPEISHQQDSRSQLNLGSLLLEEIELAQFFQTQNQSENSQLFNSNSIRLPTKIYQAASSRSCSVQARTEFNIEIEQTNELAKVNCTHLPNVVQSLKELETLLNLIPYSLFVVDIQTKSISIMNLGLAKCLDINNPEIVKGKLITECFAPDYANQILRLHQQVLTEKQVLHLQEEVTLPDGIHYFDTVITPLCNDEGLVYAILHVSSDIPNLAATQEVLSQRTLQLVAANRELESFSYSVSHDLQAPLRVINGFSQVLWDNYQSSLDTRAKHYLQRIQANSQRMSNLIDALLQLSRVTRSKMKTVTVNLSEIALDIIEELQGEAPERQIEFIIASNLIAKGDPQLLRIVLSNLLDNAWKYTSKRSLAKIEFNVVPDGKSQSTYYVRDNGAGFDLEYAGKLFTAFKRLHSQQEFPGTGIGLATVQRIIYRHGGKVWAEGERDRGATIYFSL